MKPLWKGILATLGIVLPALFTYLASRADSNEAKIRAEVAYVSMSEAVETLQKTSYAQAIELAELRGRLSAHGCAPVEEAPKPAAKPRDVPTGAAPPKRPLADGDGIPDPPAPPMKRESFDNAVQSYKAKK